MQIWTPRSKGQRSSLLSPGGQFDLQPAVIDTINNNNQQLNKHKTKFASSDNNDHVLKHVANITNKMFKMSNKENILTTFSTTVSISWILNNANKCK